MKKATVSINKVNAFVMNNQVIQMYMDLSDKYNRLVRDWRHDYYNYNFSLEMNNNLIRRLSPIGNWIYGAALNELYRKRRVDCFYRYDRDNRREVFTYEGIEFNLVCRIDIRGVLMECSCYNRGGFINEFLQHKKFKVKSNSSFEEFNMQEYFERVIVPLFLYPPGLFRDAQVVFNMSKEQLKVWYKKHRKEAADDFVDIENHLIKRIRKRLNIVVVEYTFTVSQLLHVLNTYKRRKSQKKLFKLPSVLEMHEQYSNDHDDDDHLESFVDNTLSDFGDNAIFFQ
jgi:hypothetical protein